MRCVRILLLGSLLALLLSLPTLAEEYRLANGNTLRGEIASADEDGMVVRLDVGGYSAREPWVSFSQETLRELAKNQEYRPFVTDFIELRPEELQAREKKREVIVRDVPGRVERPEGKPSLASGFLTPIGILLLLALMAANLYAAAEVAFFRNRPKWLVCGVSLVLPVLGPILFLSLPTEQPPAPPPPTPEEEAAAAAAMSVPTGAERGVGGLSLASSSDKTASGAHTQPQVYNRGEHTFNRRFFETKFPGFFRMVLGEADKDLVIVIRTARTEYVGRRISRITMNDLHFVLLSNNSEVSISFGEMTSVILKHKDAKA